MKSPLRIVSENSEEWIRESVRLMATVITNTPIFNHLNSHKMFHLLSISCRISRLLFTSVFCVHANSLRLKTELTASTFDIALAEQLVKQAGPWLDDIVLISLLWCIVLQLDKLKQLEVTEKHNLVT